MQIIYSHDTPEGALKGDYHILTFAETGFAMLNIYGDSFGIDRETLKAFEDASNRSDEPGSLHPRAPISVVPRRFIRGTEDCAALAARISEFLKANHDSIHAKKLLVDFRAGVAPWVLDAVLDALRSPHAAGIEDVVIINSN
jgi:hypothetical protein